MKKKVNRILPAVALLLSLLLSCKGKPSAGTSQPVRLITPETIKADKEQAFVNYIYSLTSRHPLNEAQDSIAAFFLRNQKDTQMIEIVNRYLYDPNSPYRNEDLYLPFVRGLAASKYTPDSLRAYYARQAEMCALNQYGQKAPDFEFRTLSEKTERLYDIDAEYLMLFFSNPGCTACKGIIDEVQSVEPLLVAQADGRLAVVNVYIDEDVQAWKDYAETYPESWHSGYDSRMVIRNSTLYNVRAIPSLYLLDKDKKVLMKDAPTENVIGYLCSVLANVNK